MTPSGSRTGLVRAAPTLRAAALAFPAAALASGLGGLAVEAKAQTACRLVEVGGYTLSARNSSASYTHYASGGVDYRCADGVRIQADSAVGFESNSSLNLYGEVRFEDAEVILEAGQAIYFGQSSYLRATQGTRVEYKLSGTVVVGDELDYYRQSDSRLVDEMTVRGGRPHATVHPPLPEAAENAVDTGTDAVDTVEAGVDILTDVADTIEVGVDIAEDTVDAAEDTVDAAVVDTAEDTVDAAVDDAVEGAQTPVEPLAPYEIDAERFVVEGRQVFNAVDDVVVVRDSLRATGDTLYYDQDSGAMSMHGNPRVGDGRFDLTARSISITPASSPGTENILAGGEAVLEGAAVAVEAPAIRLFLDGGDLSRLVALATVPATAPEAQLDTTGLTPGDQARVAERVRAAGPADSSVVQDSLPRPVARAEDLTLVADSIEVLSPGQVLQLVTAVGTARAVAARPDSMDEGTPEVARADWMEGDTIVATFLPPHSHQYQAGATGIGAGGRSLLETLVAVGSARSLYRVPPDTALAEEEQPSGPPPLHWTQGEQITMHLAHGRVVRMFVEGETLGYHLEPRPPTPADSAAAPDTSAVPAAGAQPRRRRS